MFSFFIHQTPILCSGCTVASQHKVLGLGFSVWSLYVLKLVFLPQSKDIQETGESKLHSGVNLQPFHQKTDIFIGPWNKFSANVFINIQCQYFLNYFLQYILMSSKVLWVRLGKNCDYWFKKRQTLIAGLWHDPNWFPARKSDVLHDVYTSSSI